MTNRFCLNCINCSSNAAYCLINSDFFESIKQTDCTFHREKDYAMGKKQRHNCDICAHRVVGKKKRPDYCDLKNVYFDTNRAIDCPTYQIKSLPALFREKHDKSNVVPLIPAGPKSIYKEEKTEYYQIRMVI